MPVGRIGLELLVQPAGLDTIAPFGQPASRVVLRLLTRDGSIGRSILLTRRHVFRWLRHGPIDSGRDRKNRRSGPLVEHLLEEPLEPPADPPGAEQLAKRGPEPLRLFPILSREPPPGIQRIGELESQPRQMLGRAAVQVHRQRQSRGDGVEPLGRRLVALPEVAPFDVDGGLRPARQLKLPLRVPLLDHHVAVRAEAELGRHAGLSLLQVR